MSIQAENECAPAMAACSNEINLYKDLTKSQDDFAAKLKQQRDDAVKQLDESPNHGLPFYFWAVLGAAAGVILTRGIHN